MKKYFTQTVIMKKTLTILMLLTGFAAKSQDFHLSQYDMAPLYYNPAVTGLFFDDNVKMRVCGSYRSQWQKLQGKPYSSVGVSWDMPIDRFGIGVMVMDHIAGTSNFGTFQFLTSGSYRVTDKSSKNHILTTGLQLGLFQKRFSDNALLFENQYDATNGLDPNLPAGELFPRYSLIRFDANIGIYYKYIDKNGRFDPSVGIGVYHLTMPNESFTGQKHRLPIRWAVTGACDIHAREDLTFTPNFLFMYQRKAMEINAGLLVNYAVQGSQYSLLAGGSYRHKDAIVIHLGFKQGGNIFRISYDVVTSNLKNFGGRRGGFEMGVIYTGVGKGGSRVRTSS
ncbi:MAG TPA: PorP/SprF family type IX secretion system membrane protein [Bacteroidia bacterium]|nr:PorP/SprF family type IX secretion system membrane protein [Bacteroidia bacterium]